MAESARRPDDICIKIDWKTAMVSPTVERFWRNCDPSEPPEVWWAQQEAYEKANPPYWLIPREGE